MGELFGDPPKLRPWDDKRIQGQTFESTITIGPTLHVPTRPWWVRMPTWWKPWTWHLALFRAPRAWWWDHVFALRGVDYKDVEQALGRIQEDFHANLWNAKEES